MSQDDDISAVLTASASHVFDSLATPDALREAERGVGIEARWQALAESGLHRALDRGADDDDALPPIAALSLIRLAGRCSLPLPFAETMLARWLLASAGLPVPDAMLTIAPALEAERLSLTREGSAWRLRGTISRVPWGRDAAAIVVLAEARGQALVTCLPSDQVTVTARDQSLAIEPRDTLAIDTALDADRVAPAAAGVGLTQFRAAGAAMRALQMAGALDAVLAMTVRYAQERVQFGRPIGRFQAVQQSLAVLASHVAAASAASDLAAEAFADGVRLLPIAAAKVRVGEAAGAAAAIAHQVHGAIGFTYEHALHFSTKRLWSWREEFGAEAAWSAMLGRQMLAAGPGRLWTEISAV
jgi:alkylation response protein AidB-like acyl-CoA dehydrogenase